MKVLNQHDTDAALQELLAELDRLDREWRTMDLRDQHAVDECKRRIEALRARIERYLRNREHK